MPSRLFCAFFRVGATLAVAHRPNGAGYNTLGDRKGRPYALGNALPQHRRRKRHFKNS